MAQDDGARQVARVFMAAWYPLQLAAWEEPVTGGVENTPSNRSEDWGLFFVFPFQGLVLSVMS